MEKMTATEFLEIFEELDVQKGIKKVVPTMKWDKPHFVILFFYENKLYSTTAIADFGVEDAILLGCRFNPKTLQFAESGFLTAEPL